MPWAVKMQDGTTEYHAEEPTYRSDSNRGNGRARGTNRVEIPRLPGPDEDWDFASGAFVTPAERAAERVNLEHISTHGPYARAVAHAVKLIEARMILGLPTAIELEADAIGCTREELAQVVIDRAAETAAAEVQRIVARRIARGLPV